MTNEQCLEMIDLIKASAVPYTWPDDFFKEVILHLRPLPYEWCVRRARSWATQPAVDGRGSEVPKFCNSLPEVLRAVGVPVGARDDLARAAYDGAELWPDLRNVNELTYVSATDPVPQGCFEYLVSNGLPVPRRPILPSLPAPPPVAAHGEATAFLAKLRERDRRRVPVRRPRTPEVRDLLDVLDANPNLPPGVVQAVKMLAWHVDALASTYRDTIADAEDRAAELQAALLAAASPPTDDAPDDPPVEGVLEAIRRLVRIVRAVYPAYLPAVREVVDPPPPPPPPSRPPPPAPEQAARKPGRHPRRMVDVLRQPGPYRS